MSIPPEKNAVTFANIEVLLKVVKELTLIVLLLYVGWHLAPLVPRWMSKLDAAQVSEISVAGFGIKLAQVEQTLKENVKVSGPQKTANDEVVSPEKRNVALALETVHKLKTQAASAYPTHDRSPASEKEEKRTQGRSWVYLGTSLRGVVSSKTFRATQTPSVGESLEAISDVYKRATSPSLDEANGLWTLGEIIGAVSPGDRVTVLRVSKRDSTKQGEEIIWLEVTHSR